MREINKVFFTEGKGLTQTSANYLANLAQEIIKGNLEKLNSISFINEELSIIGSADKQVSHIGIDSDEFDSRLELLKQNIQMNSFCAWMREAIKAKEFELDHISTLSFDEWFNEVYDGDKRLIPEAPLKKEDPVHPTEPKYELIVKKSYTLDDIIAKLSVKDRNEYFYLQAAASTLGKFIHPDGSISKARIELHNKLNNPIETSLSGRDTIIRYFDESINPSKVDDKFYELQQLHRSYEQRLNAIKFKLQEQLKDLQLQAETEYRESQSRNNKLENEYKDELNKWKSECDKIRFEYNSAFDQYLIDKRDYNNWLEDLKTEFNKYVISEKNRISKLKIIVPDELKNTFEYLNQLDKMMVIEL